MVSSLAHDANSAVHAAARPTMTRFTDTAMLVSVPSP
jgi:hypothetical protein